MIQERKVWEIFRDDFRGKLAEIKVRNFFIEKTNYQIVSDLDFTISGLGTWDTNDIVVRKHTSNNLTEEMNLSIKSVKKHSSNLLLETHRFNPDGSCSYKNNDGTEIKIDAYVLVEIDIAPEFSEDIYIETTDEFKEYEYIKKKIKVKRTILGQISHKDFWNIKAFAPSGIICNVNNFNEIFYNKTLYKENNLDTYLNLPSYYMDKSSRLCFYHQNAYKASIVKGNGNNIVLVNPNYPIYLKQNNYFVTKAQLKPLINL